MTMSTCKFICKTGKQCSRKATHKFCAFHNTDKPKIGKVSEICTAICSNGKKCMRKCCIGIQFCGTHKPFSEIVAVSDIKPNTITCAHSVFVEDIDGIAYYMDSHGNVFNAEDILRQSLTPRIIAKYSRNVCGEFILDFSKQ
jgi:hypothetical protein